MRSGTEKIIRKSALLFLALLSVAAVSVRAYVPLRWGSNGVRGAWDVSRFPLAFYVNEGMVKGTPNVTTGSNALAAVRGALSAWESIPTAGIRFADLKAAPADSAVADGLNLITMADSASNRDILGGDLGPLALTRLVYDAVTGEITESDILINSKYQFSTNLAPYTYDLQAILTHELGHALGSDHSPLQNDTMFFETGPGEFFQRYLSGDAIAFASFTYPNRTRIDSLGSISGRVTSGGKSIFGASVTAVNLDRNLVYAAYSEPDGSYTINGPVAGRYTIYAEPLDGPATPDQLLVQGAGAYYKGLNTSFRTSFAEEQSLGLGGLPRKLLVNIAVPVGVPLLNIDRLGRGDPETGLGYLSSGSVIASPGETVTLWIGGTNTWKVAGIGDVRILGAGVEVDPSRGLKVLRDGTGVEVGISVLLHIAPDAAPGARTVLLKVGDQQVASTGAIVVAPRSLPATTLYMPYLKIDPGRYTGIALVNGTAETPAVIRMACRDSQGALLWSEDATVPLDLTLPGGKQAARLERQIFNFQFDADRDGSITVESDSANLRGMFLTGDFAGTFLNGAEAFMRGYKQLIFAEVLQDAHASTEIHLMNTRDVPATVDLVLVDGNGGILRGPLRRTIPVGGKIGEKVTTLFGFSGELHAAHVLATATDEMLAGFELISQSTSARTAAVFGINGLPLENAGTVLYSPQLAVGEFGFRFETRLNVVNVGDYRTTATVTLLDERGQPLVPESKAVDLMPGAHLSFDVRSMFGLEHGQGYIKVTASGGGQLVGDVLFGDGDPTMGPLEFGAVLPLISSGARNFLFAHLAQGPGYYTGVAFLAPDGATVTIEAYDSDGKAKGSPATIVLTPGQRLAALLSALIPETAGQVGGYVKVTSQTPVIGFELFGSTDGRLLTAVPPQRLRD